MTVAYEVDAGPDLAPVLLSHSRRSGYLRCPNQLRLKKGGFPVKPALALMAGTAFHAACDDVDYNYASPTTAWLDRITIEYEKALTQEPDLNEWKVSGRKSKDKPNKEDWTWWFDAGASMVESYAEYRKLERSVGMDIWTLPNDDLAIEVPFEFDLNLEKYDLKVKVRGSIDRILCQGDTLIIRDHKTSQRVPNDDGQLGIYRLAMKHLFGLDVEWGDYYMSREGASTPPVSLLHYTEELWADEYGAVAKAMRDQLYPANPGDHCGYCEVKDGCAIKGGALAKEWLFVLP